LRRLPGDELVDRPTRVRTHADVVDASAAAIWPWLVQIAGRLVSQSSVTPGRSERRLSRHTTAITTFEPDRVLVLHATSELVDRGRRGRGHVDRVWAFVLDDLGNGRTEVVLRVTAAARPWRAALVCRLGAIGENGRAQRLFTHLAERAVTGEQLRRSGGAARAAGGWDQDGVGSLPHRRSRSLP